MSAVEESDAIGHTSAQTAVTHVDAASPSAPSTPNMPTDAASPTVKLPEDAMDHIKQLINSGDLEGAEVALKLFKKQMKKSASADRNKDDSSKKEKKEKRATEALVVVEGDEHKARRASEKEQKRDYEAIEKLSKESHKLAVEADAKRAKEEKQAKDRDARDRKDEKKDRERIEKSRRDAEKLETETRKELAKLEKSEFDEVDRQRKASEKLIKEKDRRPAPKQKPQPVRSLHAYGFSTEKRQLAADSEGLLFSQFVQDKRIVPSRLCFWNDGTARELSLGDSTPSATGPMETSCSVPEGFCREVVFCGFSAIGFEPAQARPSYWGTMNPTLNHDELASLVRYPLDDAMPRLSTLNYECDSGDDWDAMDSDDDDVDASDDEEIESDSGSEDSFIDDDAHSDSDTENVSSFITARARRQNRLRGKDRLVPVFSGPYETHTAASHPLSSLSRFALASGVDHAFIEQTMLDELSRLTGTDLAAVKTKSQVQRYRQIGDDEVEEIHAFLLLNARIAQASAVEIISKRPSFGGVAAAEVRRVLKRYYDNNGGAFVRRDVPWAVDDPRLFEKKLPKEKLPQERATIEREKRPRSDDGDE
ncbi:Hypothetical protein, putative [Bodo saltans]|uniref:Chromatin assembly factor 1 subunit A dimerization domain-containing protein n=1 Tax=Bodo saltans TaxID=75058 RepID=A0A0S4JPQ8_BODSA|nr:Hypothetical protein, putative [Bodo saltans]|eukprot:CUG92307.1 Hypothetical protein, putative [Bodo saltans]